MKEETHTVYLALGSNMGNRRQMLDAAIEKINNQVGRVEAVSEVYETTPEGFQSSHLFLNAALRVQTNLTPRQVLVATQRIERQLGRKRKSINQHYSDRSIDIDILLYDDCRVDEPDLQIPHPRMYEREFVMKPLADVLLSEGQ